MTKTMLPVLICLLYISANVQGDSFERSLDRSSGVKEEPGKVFQANAYARANCGYPGATFPRNCTATVTYFNRKGVIDEGTCGLMSLINPIDGQKQHQIKFSLQKNKAIFVYENQGGNGLVQQYQMVEPRSNGCTKYITYPIPLGSYLTHIRQMNIATITNVIVHDNNNYDIITYGDCGGARCIYSFVGDNKGIRGRPYLPQMYLDHAVKVFPSTKSDAHFTIVSEWQSVFRDRRKPIQDYYSSNGFSSEKLLYVQHGYEQGPIQLASFNYGNAGVPETFVDNSNGLFSYCRNIRVGIDYAVHCLQFDERDVIFNKTITLKYYEKLLTIYNIPKGGILFVKSNCQSERACKDLFFEKKTLDSKDEKEHKLSDALFNLPVLKAIVHEEDDDQLCLTMYNNDILQGSGYDVFLECVSNSFFKNGARAQNYISISYLLTFVVMLFFTVN